MARKPRIHFPGALYHVMLRGNDGQEIFFDDYDREIFSALVEEGAKRYGHLIYAYCWMTNHVHLAIEVNNESLSKIIQNLSFRYTRYINKKFNRIGHLFQGRYKAILVDKESYLLELIRYIHLNPIRAKMVTKTEDYQWSGHRIYLGLDRVSWLETEIPLMLFAQKKARAIKDYDIFIKEGIGQNKINFEEGEKDSRIIGDEEFVDKIKFEQEDDERCFDLRLIIESTCNLLSISKKSLMHKTKKREITFARHLIAYINKWHGNITTSRLAEMYGIDPSGLSRAIAKIEKENSQIFLEEVKAVIDLNVKMSCLTP